MKSLEEKLVKFIQEQVKMQDLKSNFRFIRRN